MLSPSKKDKNCKAEQKRAKEHPEDFGDYSNKSLPKDYSPNKGLKKAIDDTSEEVEENESNEQTPEERTALLVEAIKELEEGNEEHFTGEGLPRVEVLEAKTGIIDVSAEERNTAFEAFNKAKEDNK